MTVIKHRSYGTIVYEKNHVVIPAQTLESARNKATKVGFVKVSEGKQLKSMGIKKGMKMYKFPHK